VEILIASAKELASASMERFCKVFSFVPDDKLTWSPTPTAKSSIRIAAHTALYAAKFAHMINARKLPNIENIAERLAQRDATEVAITDRAEIEPIFRKGTNEVLAALDSLTPEDIELTLDSGFGWSVPMTWLMTLPGMHTHSHTAQIDYLQTCWDDQVVHF
jgi:DinB superfamily